GESGSGRHRLVRRADSHAAHPADRPLRSNTEIARMSAVTPTTTADRDLDTRARGGGPSAAYSTRFVGVVCALALCPLLLPEFWQRFATELLLWGLLAISSDILIV